MLVGQPIVLKIREQVNPTTTGVGDIQEEVARKGSLNVEIPLLAVRRVNVPVVSGNRLPNERLEARRTPSRPDKPIRKGIRQIVRGIDVVEAADPGSSGFEARDG